MVAISISVVVSYLHVPYMTYYPLLSSLDVPVDMVHLLQSNHRWSAGLALYLLYPYMVLLKCNFTHAYVYWLVRTCVQTCVPLRVMEHSRVALTVHACYTKGCKHVDAAWVDTCIGMYTYVTRMLPMCSRKSVRRIVSQSTYSSDIISGYSEWVSVVIKILTYITWDV